MKDETLPPDPCHLKPPKPHVRWMIRRDMPAVLAIERASFEFPWSEEDFVRTLRGCDNIGMVAERNDQVHGFMVYALKQGRIELLNLAVAPLYRFEGLGTAMIDKIKGKLGHGMSTHRDRITLAVRETNVAAQMFFRSQGFRATGVLRDFYDDSEEDAYAFAYKLER